MHTYTLDAVLLTPEEQAVQPSKVVRAAHARPSLPVVMVFVVCRSSHSCEAKSRSDVRARDYGSGADLCFIYGVKQSRDHESMRHCLVFSTAFHCGDVIRRDHIWARAEMQF